MSEHSINMRQKRSMIIVIIYPIIVILLSILFNLFIFEVQPFNVDLPTIEIISSLTIASVLLIVNHTWLMTSTELTRVRFKLYSTPEEWESSGTNRKDASEKGIQEVERRHNIHRNTTENTIYYILFSLPFLFVSPTTLGIKVWLVGYPVARLGYTYSYLAGKDNVRGFFMTISLLALYGLVSYLVISLLI